MGSGKVPNISIRLMYLAYLAVSFAFRLSKEDDQESARVSRSCQLRQGSSAVADDAMALVLKWATDK